MTASGSRTFLVSVVAVGSVIAIWHLVAQDMDPLLLPTPPMVVGAAIELWEQDRLQGDILVSLQRVYAGWLIGSAIAIPIGLLAGTSRYARAAVDPFIHFFRFIPALALTSLFILWFGIGEASKVNLVVYAVMFIVLVSTASGAASVSQDKLLGAQTMGANRLDLFFRITLPASFSSIFIGMRLALAAAFLVIVAAEAIAAQEGIGFLIWNARTFFRTDFVFVGILLFGILGFLSDRLWKLLGRTVFRRYLTNLGDY